MSETREISEKEAAFEEAFGTIPRWKQIGINLFARENKLLYWSWFARGWDARVEQEARGATRMPSSAKASHD